MVSWIKVILLMGVTYVYKLYKCLSMWQQSDNVRKYLSNICRRHHPSIPIALLAEGGRSFRTALSITLSVIVLCPFSLAKSSTAFLAIPFANGGTFSSLARAPSVHSMSGRESGAAFMISSGFIPLPAMKTLHGTIRNRFSVLLPISDSDTLWNPKRPIIRREGCPAFTALSILLYTFPAISVVLISTPLALAIFAATSR